LQAVETARGEVAALLGAQAAEIVFTAGATESNNITILGLARGPLAKGLATKRRRLVTTAIEHKAVRGPCAALCEDGFETVVLPVNGAGRVCRDAAAQAIDEKTLLVSIQAANNEVGTIQDIAHIASLCREAGALLHTDAAQATGKIPVDVTAWDVDFLSLSAHKMCGPKGVGALYVRSGLKPFLAPPELGGGQEGGLRSGTLNVPGIVGLGAACRIAQSEMHDEEGRVSALRDRFEALLRELVPDVRFNGCHTRRLSCNSSVTFPGVPAEALLSQLPHLALSAGSACSAGAIEVSPVLTAMGLCPEHAACTLRAGLGRFTTEDEIEIAARDLAHAYDRQSLFSLV
jgi:cysteine desulfurase